MKSIVSITIAILALAKAASCQLEWYDVCDYSDPSGAKCCAPGMEGHQYLVVAEDLNWTNHALECQ